LNVAGARPGGHTSIRANGAAVGSNFFGQSSFATYALAYERNTVKVPAGAMPPELLAPLGCGVQTGVGGIMRSLACEQDSSLLILGGGAVGLSAVMGAAIRGCSRVIVVEPHAERRDLALSLGATDVIDPLVSQDIAAAVLAIEPSGLDYALDTTGLPGLQSAAIDCLGPKGVLGVVGITPPGTPPPGEMNAIMAAGKSIKGIIEGDSDPDIFIPQLIALHAAGRLPLERLVKTYPFAEINRAIADQHAGKCVKVVLLMEEA
jgi:aryl-alcohol dehydrogenase